MVVLQLSFGVFAFAVFVPLVLEFSSSQFGMTKYSMVLLWNSLMQYMIIMPVVENLKCIVNF